MDEATRWASVESSVAGMAASMQSMVTSITQLNHKMDRMDVAVIALARVEERNADHANAIQRAFSKMEVEAVERAKLQIRIEIIEKEGIKAKALVRGIFIGTGAILTVVTGLVIWAVNTLVANLPAIVAAAAVAS